MLKFGVTLTEEQNLIYETAKQIDRLKPNAEAWDAEKSSRGRPFSIGRAWAMGIYIPMKHGRAEADTLSYVLAAGAG